MPDFDGFEAFGRFFRYAVIPGYLLALNAALDECGARILDRIQDKIGVPQGPSHGYPGWAPLAPSTLQGWGPNPGKIALGQTGRKSAEDPWYATGQVSQTLSYIVHKQDLAVTAGSPEDQAFFGEFGTINQPPRPLFRPAAEEVVEEMLPRFAQFAAAGIAGASVRTLYTSPRLAMFGAGRGYVNAARASFSGFGRGSGFWRP